MSLIIPANSLAGGGYAVDNSLRFNSASTDYLNHTNGTPTGTTKYTFSTWLKRSKLTSRGQFFRVINPSSTALYAYLETDGSNFFGFNDNDGVTSNSFTTNAVYRDVSAWYHLVLIVDTTQATSTDRWKFYVNGVQVTSFASTGYGTLNQVVTATSSGRDVNIGGDPVGAGATRKFDGYMANVYFIDGQALTPTDFGEFDADSGVWKPIAYSGSYGTNGFFLEFQDSGALGTDTSGEGNNFTVNNLTSIDQTTDTPTNNFATWNSLIKYSSTMSLSEGNLKGVTGSAHETNCQSFFTTIAMTQGKWYAEFKVDTVNDTVIGVSNDLNTNLGGSGTSAYNFSYLSSGYGYYNSGVKYNNNTSASYGDSYTTNDIIGVALDLDNNYVYFSKNGTFQNSGVPTSGATGTGSAYSVTAYSGSNPYFFCVGDIAQVPQTTVSANFGNAPYTIASGNADENSIGNFEYSVPSGYLALCTSNLSEVNS